jgi:hypothetical protein
MGLEGQHIQTNIQTNSMENWLCSLHKNIILATHC